MLFLDILWLLFLLLLAGAGVFGIGWIRAKRQLREETESTTGVPTERKETDEQN